MSLEESVEELPISPPTKLRIQHIISQKLKNAHNTPIGQGACHKGANESPTLNALEVDPIMKFHFQKMIHGPKTCDPIPQVSSDQVLRPVKRIKMAVGDQVIDDTKDSMLEDKDDNNLSSQLGTKALNAWLVLNGGSELSKQEILFNIKNVSHPISILAQKLSLLQSKQELGDSIDENDANLHLDTFPTQISCFTDENLSINKLQSTLESLPKSNIDMLRDKISGVYNELCAEEKNLEFRYPKALHELTVTDIVGEIQSMDSLIAAAKEREKCIIEESKQLGLYGLPNDMILQENREEC
jgi:hypothetical protein